MSRLLVLAVAAAIGATGLAATFHPARLSAAAAVNAEVYWRCPSGYAFETSGSAVHCKKPAWTETKPAMSCVIPTPNLKFDLVGTTDMCSGGIGIAVTAEPLCYPTDLSNGYVKHHVAGKDFCGKFHPVEIIAPNQVITF